MKKMLIWIMLIVIGASSFALVDNKSGMKSKVMQLGYHLDNESKGEGYHSYYFRNDNEGRFRRMVAIRQETGLEEIQIDSMYSFMKDRSDLVKSDVILTIDNIKKYIPEEVYNATKLSVKNIDFNSSDSIIRKKVNNKVDILIIKGKNNISLSITEQK